MFFITTVAGIAVFIDLLSDIIKEAIETFRELKPKMKANWEIQIAETKRIVNKYRRKSISCLIVCVMFLTIFSIYSSENTQASKTGSIYSGSGDWTITTPTVYTDEIFTVYGYITINSGGSLTLINSEMTIIEGPNGENYNDIYVNYGFLKIGKNSLVTTNNHTTGYWNCVIYNAHQAGIYISNATVEYAYIDITNSVVPSTWYIDNSTLNSCQIKLTSGGGGNISSNIINDSYTNEAVIISSTANTIISNNTFNSIVMDFELGNDQISVISIYYAGANNKIIKNTFTSIINFSAINIEGANTAIVSRNTILNVSSNQNEFTQPASGIILRGDADWTIIDNNTINTVYSNYSHETSTASIGISSNNNPSIATQYLISDNIIGKIEKRISGSNSSIGIFWNGGEVKILRNKINAINSIDDDYECNGYFLNNSAQATSIFYSMKTNNNINDLIISPLYFQIHSIRMNITVSSGNIFITIMSFDYSIIWKSTLSVPSATIEYEITNLDNSYGYKLYENDEIIIQQNMGYDVISFDDSTAQNSIYRLTKWGYNPYAVPFAFLMFFLIFCGIVIATTVIISREISWKNR